MRIINNCQLEIDEDRGVLYVHGPNGITLVRASKIPYQTIRSEMIDITFDRELAKPLNRKSKSAIEREIYFRSKNGS